MKSLKLAPITLLSVLLVFATACSSGGDESSNSNPPPVDDKPTPVKNSLSWDEAPCQKQKNCNNFVLEISFDQWKTILNQTEAAWAQKYNVDASQSTADSKALYCGAMMYQSLREEVNLSRELGDEERAQIVDFAGEIMDLAECKRSPNLKKDMDAYLKKTSND